MYEACEGRARKAFPEDQRDRRSAPRVIDPAYPDYGKRPHEKWISRIGRGVVRGFRNYPGTDRGPLRLAHGVQRRAGVRQLGANLSRLAAELPGLARCPARAGLAGRPTRLVAGAAGGLSPASGLPGLPGTAAVSGAGVSAAG